MPGKGGSTQEGPEGRERVTHWRMKIEEPGPGRGEKHAK